MQIQLTPRVEEIVRDILATGQYHDAEAIIEEAVLRLEDERKLAALRASLAEAEAEDARGESARFTPDLVAQMESAAQQMLRDGREPDPDVCP